MAVNAYGKKVFEDEKDVIFNYGSKYDNLSGKIKFNKNTLEPTIISSDVGDSSNRKAFKIVAKVVNTYKETGKFPDNPSSQS